MALSILLLLTGAHTPTTSATPLTAIQTHTPPPPPLLFSKTSHSHHQTPNKGENTYQNHYYQLQEWDNLLAALDPDKWKTNLTKLIQKPTELSPSLIYSDGYIIEHLDSSDTFTIAVQKCYARKAQIFGPRTVEEQLKMLSTLSKSNNGQIWVILVPITHSKKAAYINGEFLPPYLFNEQNLRVNLAPPEKPNPANCTSLHLRSPAFTTVACTTSMNTFCAYPSDRENQIEIAKTQNSTVHTFLNHIKYLSSIAPSILNPLQQIWLNTNTTPTCPSSTTWTLASIPNITSLDPGINLELTWTIETIRENLLDLRILLKLLQSIPKIFHKRTKTGFCIPVFPINRSDPSFPSPSDSSSFPIHKDPHWWSFSLMDLLLTACSIFLATVAFLNCLCTCCLTRQKRQPPPKRQQTQDTHKPTTSTEVLRLTQVQHPIEPQLKRASSVQFLPYVQHYPIPSRSSSYSSLGERMMPDLYSKAH
jgi:hypothetical protein